MVAMHTAGVGQGDGEGAVVTTAAAMHTAGVVQCDGEGPVVTPAAAMHNAGAGRRDGEGPVVTPTAAMHNAGVGGQCDGEGVSLWQSTTLVSENAAARHNAGIGQRDSEGKRLPLGYFFLQSDAAQQRRAVSMTSGMVLPMGRLSARKMR